MDLVKEVDSAGGPPRVVARARHGGDLTDAVPIAGSWVVYLEYLQQGNGSNAQFWYLSAVNLQSGTSIDLAHATSGAALRELPGYDAEGDYAVWNQVGPAGTEILRSYDFATRQSATLPLPNSMAPFEPTVSGSSVIFVNNATDSKRSHERGSLMRFDLTTHRLTTLNKAPTAWMPRARGGEVVWTNIAASATNAFGVTAETVMGMVINRHQLATVGGNYAFTPQTNGSLIVWYDSRTLRFMAATLNPKRIVQLQVGAWHDIRSVFALCGKRLFFARPLAEDGGTTTIRVVDLSSLHLPG